MALRPGWAQGHVTYELYVDMTSTVKSREAYLLFVLLLSREHGTGERRDLCVRRLITLIFVGWLPPTLRPSGVCPRTMLEDPTRPPNVFEGYAHGRGRASLPNPVLCSLPPQLANTA